MRKKEWFAVLALAAVFTFLTVRFWGQSAITSTPGGLLTGCPPKAVKALIYCNVAGDASNPDGLYLSANGADYFRVSPPQAAGVTSWNGQTGVVTYAPTQISCTTASLSTGSTGSFTGSGCTIK